MIWKPIIVILLVCLFLILSMSLGNCEEIDVNNLYLEGTYEIHKGEFAPFDGMLIDEKLLVETVIDLNEGEKCKTNLKECLGIDKPFYYSPEFLIGTSITLFLAGYLIGSR